MIQPSDSAIDLNLISAVYLVAFDVGYGMIVAEYILYGRDPELSTFLCGYYVCTCYVVCPSLLFSRCEDPNSW
ncbi:hypothetical protein IW262DRAFT_886860 [Armillaria fumosa]|nr:hypothetical protein IW262DRAFT_886860 [Armillaria fumosa]